MAIPDVSELPLTALMSLEGRTAVVTGGASGIGRAICHRLAEAGAAVLVADRNEAAALEAAHKIGSATSAFLEAADSASQDALAQRAFALAGRLDIWVNCAGIFPSQPALDITDKDWERVQDINLDGTFFGCRAAARQMQGRGGVILNIASTAGIRPAGPGYAHYASSKAGVIALTQSLAREWGSLGIRVLALAPSFVHTPGTAAQSAAFRATTGRGGDEIGASLPLGRAGLPDDIARVALFCVSDLALYLTGVTIPVDGGRLLI